jgi:hypothetical protein
MVFLVLTRGGYMQFTRIFHKGLNITLWVNSRVLNDEELAQLRAAGLSVTNFTESVDASDDSAVSNAVETIKEHHPGVCVWIER